MVKTIKTFYLDVRIIKKLERLRQLLTEERNKSVSASEAVATAIENELIRAEQREAERKRGLHY